MMKKNFIFGASVIFILLLLLIVIYNGLVYPQLDARNFPLREEWSMRLDDKILEISGAENSHLVFARTDQSLYAIDTRTGQIIWKFNLYNQVETSPAVSIANVLYIADAKNLWALSHENGEVIWSHTLPEVSGWVVDVSDTAVLVNNRPSNISVYDSKTGSLLWDYPVARHHVKAYFSEDTVYIPNNGIHAIDRVTGQLIWSTDNEQIGDSGYYDGIIYYISEKAVVAFNTYDQTESWRQPVSMSDYAIPQLSVYGNFVVVLDGYSVFVLERETGKLDWKSSAFVLPLNPSFIGNDLFVLEGFDQKITSLRLDTGKENGQLKISIHQYFPVPRRQSMIALENFLFFSRVNELICFSVKSD